MATKADKLKDQREKLRVLRKKIREAERLAGGSDPYSRHREDMAAQARERSASGREIGPLPPIADPDRRQACFTDDLLFLRTYFPARFYLPFSEAHRQAIGLINQCTREGGTGVCAMPRGFGKDTITEALAMKALLYGLRRFVVVIQATADHAKKALKRLERELETNDLLLADFPEVCYPIRCLDRINQRAKGQTLGGIPTRLEFTAEGLVFPTVPGSPSSGSAVQVYGLTGALRGLQVLGPDGKPFRPDLVIVNDAQTRESARSPTQTAEREATICDDVLMLAGPVTKIAAVMLGTVIYPNDLTARFLDSDRHPEWEAVRTQMLLSFPSDLEKWDQYAELRREGLREGDGGKRATEFYHANREAMDAGAAVSWPERKKDDEESGIQSAMNLYYDNPRGFFAECQNDPKAEAAAEGAKEIVAADVARRLSGLDRFVVPRECTRVTAFIDVGGSVHWYLVAAWTERGGGSIIDYGCYPRQNRGWFEARDARPNLSQAFPGRTESQLVFAGLQSLVGEVLSRTYPHEGGGDLPINRCLIDAGWNTSAVFQFIRSSPHVATIYPSKGVGRTTSSRGVSEWTKRPGERVGYHWRLTVPEAGRVRMVQFDPDAWKSKAHELLTTPPGGLVALTLFGQERKVDHEMIAAHLAAEYSEPITLRGTTFDKWQVRPDRPDNHLLDCLVGSAVAAAVDGLEWSATGKPEPPAPQAPRKKFSEMQREKMRARAGA